jgi:hypothetical protein
VVMSNGGRTALRAALGLVVRWDALVPVVLFLAAGCVALPRQTPRPPRILAVARSCGDEAATHPIDLVSPLDIICTH